MTKKSNDELLMGLALALDHEHRGRTGHDYTRRRHAGPLYRCACCDWLKIVTDELAERHYRALAQEQAESVAADRP